MNDLREIRSEHAMRNEGEHGDGPEVIIVGSGVVGSAAAAMLGAEGRDVTVIERDLSQPDRIVGELLQPGGCQALTELGLQDCLEGIDAQPVVGYLLQCPSRGRDVAVGYPYQHVTDSTDTAPACGKAFHHGRFVQALRTAAMSYNSVHYVQGTVVSLIENDEGQVTGVRYKVKDADSTQEVLAPLTVVADGCFSRFRKQLVQGRPTTMSHFVGLLVSECSQRKAHHAEVILTEPQPVLAYRICSTYTRVLVDIQGKIPTNLKSHMLTHILPQLPDHLQEPFEEAVREKRMRVMPNSFLSSAPLIKAGVLCLGDALNMRHPLTGGGMTVGLSDVVLFRDLLIRRVQHMQDTVSVTQAARDIYRQRKRSHSFVVNVLAVALYSLFAADDDCMSQLKDSCFEYLRLGGECTDGPAALLSVLNPSPLLLVRHFFSVALYAAYRILRQGYWWQVPHGLLTSVQVISKAVTVFCPLVWSERHNLFS